MKVRGFGVAFWVFTLVLVLVVATAGAVWWIRNPDLGRSADAGPAHAAAWSVRLTGLGPVRTATVTGDAVVVVGEEKLAVLDKRDGRLRWDKPIDQRRVRVGDGGVVVYSRGSATVYDLGTGEERFARTFTGDVAVTTSTAVVNDCPDGGARCQLVAVDLATGGQRWQTSYPRHPGWEQSWASVEVLGSPMVLGGNQRAEPMSTRSAEVVLVREGREPDGRWKTVSRSITTGEPVGTYSLPEGTAWTVTDQTLLSWDIRRKECDVPVTAFNPRTGERTWTVTAGQWHLPEGVYGAHDVTCEGSAWAPMVAGPSMVTMTTDARAQLVDLATGQVRWTGEQGVHALALTDGAVIARGDGGDADELVGLDPRDGRRTWTAPLPDDGLGDTEWLNRTAAVGNRFLYSYTYTYPGPGVRFREVLRLVDGTSGRLMWAADGSNFLLGAGDDWVLAGGPGIEDPDQPAEIRLFTG
jgi:outer membrane protein assembly factor BamB